MLDVDAVKCPFCQMAQGELASYTVLEDAISLAFLDHHPVFPGHCLLIPRVHVATLDEVPEDLIGPLFANVQQLARAVELALRADGSFVGLNNRVSQSVPHLHIHVVPRRRGDGLRGFFWPRQRYPDEASILRTQRAIRSALDFRPPES